MPLGQPLEHVRAEVGGRGDADAGHYEARSRSAGRRTASAPRRASSVVRSRISTPSRWSSSCCSDAGGEPLELELTSSPCSSTPSTVTRQPPLDGHGHALQREAALVVGLSSSERLAQHGVDERDRLLLVRLHARARAGARRPGSPRARRRSRPASATSSARRAARARRRSSRPRSRACAARDRRTGESGRARPACAPRALGPAGSRLTSPASSSIALSVGRPSKRLRVDVDDGASDRPCASPARPPRAAAPPRRRTRRAGRSWRRAGPGGGRAGAAAGPGRGSSASATAELVAKL